MKKLPYNTVPTNTIYFDLNFLNIDMENAIRKPMISFILKVDTYMKTDNKDLHFNILPSE